ncbi:MAG: permease [Magnetococcales bacterium]|nr:permease [Magnetococcales bacterium]
MGSRIIPIEPSAAAASDPLRQRWVLSATLLLFVAGFFYLPTLEIFQPNVTDQLFNESIAPVRWRENFTSYFISIVLEAAPYMVLGAFLSGLIEILVPSQWLPDMARRLGRLGIPAVVLLAPLFPICECGVVMVARRLLRKGLPMGHTIAYLLAAPILNPVVLGGTWLAFFRDPLYPLMRGAGAFFIAIALGLLLHRPFTRNALREGWRGVDHPDHGLAGQGWLERGRHLLEHVRTDFLDMGLYFLFGVFLASCLKTFVDWEWLDQLGGGPFTGPLAMMGAAFVMSLCSEADAFVAASFIEFDMYAHTAFLVLGPMIDIKLLLMYQSLFRTRHIALFALAVVTAVSLYVALLMLLPEGFLDWFSMRGMM